MHRALNTALSWEISCGVYSLALSAHEEKNTPSAVGTKASISTVT